MTRASIEKRDWDLCAGIAERLVKEEIAPVIEQAFARLEATNASAGMRPLLGNMVAAQVSGHMLLDSLGFAKPGCAAAVCEQFTRMVGDGLLAGAALADRVYSRESVH